VNPTFLAAPGRDRDDYQPGENMLGPVAITARESHDLFGMTVPVPNDPLPCCGIEVKGGRDRHNRKK
jgi:hypothetical protein